MKIFVFGVNRTGFLNQLYSALKRYKPIHVSIGDIVPLFTEGVHDAGAFDLMGTKKVTARSIGFWILRVPKLALGLCWSLALLSLNRAEGRHSIKLVLKGYVNAGLYQHLVDRDSVLHLHFCSIINMVLLYFLAQNHQVICSFWGSDLLRSCGVSNNFWIRKGLEKADKIHVATLDMKEIVLSKFGRDLKQKTFTALFIPDIRLVDLIDDFKDDMTRQASFKQKFGLTDFESIIAIGHNGHAANQHLAILSSLEGHAEKFNNCCFVLPLSYGLTQPYLESLKAYVTDSELHIKLLDSYIDWEDLALLKVCTDLMIMMPESDSMSSSYTEAMFAGAACIAGSWLPYGNLRRIGCVFWEADTYRSLPSLVCELLGDRSGVQASTRKNNKLLREFYYDEEKLVQDWLEIFEKKAS